MKKSGAPSIGDLVIALDDEARGIACAGLVLEYRGQECKIMWHSENTPVGWWKRWKLKVIGEAKK